MYSHEGERELSVLFPDCTQPHSLIQSNNITNKEIVASKLKVKTRIYHLLLQNIIINDKVYKIVYNVYKMKPHQHEGFKKQTRNQKGRHDGSHL